jgi:hypothetical protein
MNTQEQTSGPIVFRWPEPTQDARPGDGYVDEVAAYIAEAGQKTAAMPPEGSYTARLRGPFVIGGKGVRDLHDHVWSLRDGFEKTRKDAASALGQLAGNTLRSAQVGMRNRLVEGKADASATTAQAALDGLNGAADALDAAMFDVTAPSGLNDDLALDDHVKDVAMVNDLRARPAAMRDLLNMIEHYGAEGMSDRMRRICRVGLELAIELRDTPPAKVKARTSNSAQPAPFMTEERDLAILVINQIRRFQRAAVPQEIRLAQDALRLLDQAFAVLAGVHGRYVSYGDIMSNPKLLSFLDASKSDAARPWQLDPKWVGRFLPPDGFELPGWSPIVIRKTKVGGVVRDARRA